MSLSQKSFWDTTSVNMPTGKEPCPHTPNPKPAAGFPCWPAHLLSMCTRQNWGGRDEVEFPGMHNPTSSFVLTPLIQLSKVGISKRNFPREVKVKRESTTGPRPLTGARAIFSLDR